MSYQLVIAEKPSVARSIAGVIGADKKQDGYMEGNGYLVSWCMTTCISRPFAGRRRIGWWGSTRPGCSPSSTTRP